MSVGFGFSVGDFIAGIQLVRDVITSLQASGGASHEYQSLAMELFSLERALLEVKALRPSEQRADQLDALKCSASQCQSTIDRFMTKIQKYQPSLSAQGSGSKWRDGVRKVQWALCRKEDVAAFKAEISGHAVAINLLLATTQFNATSIMFDQSQPQNASTAVSAQSSWSMTALNSLKDGVASCLRQGQELLAMSKRIVQMNLQMFHTILEIQKFITSLPAQVLRQQPVYFTDAYGLEVPFHLEFVYSSEILQDWLVRRFPQDKDKIKYGDFVIQGAMTKRQIQLTDQWATLFRPGMRVTMEMVYRFPWLWNNLMSSMDAIMKGKHCPVCLVKERNLGEEINCSSCGIFYHRPKLDDIPDMSTSESFTGRAYVPTHLRRFRIEFLTGYLNSIPKQIPNWLIGGIEALLLKYLGDLSAFRVHRVMFDFQVPFSPGAGIAGLDLGPCVQCVYCSNELLTTKHESGGLFYIQDETRLGILETHLQSPFHCSSRRSIESRARTGMSSTSPLRRVRRISWCENDREEDT